MGFKVEIRSDSVEISGYVNATEKQSRPVITPHGKAIEIMQEGVFSNAIKENNNIALTIDHQAEPVYASTLNGDLELYEDGIGLHAKAIVKDEKVIQLARDGKITGWSFGMVVTDDELEERAEDIPIRRVKSIEMDHVTLTVSAKPVYAATSVEVRAGTEKMIETRSFNQKVETKNKVDISSFIERARKLDLKGNK